MLKPEDLTILVDSREKNPYTSFVLGKQEIPSKIQALRTGDYSVEIGGHSLEDIVACERKSLPDLIGCITASRSRFKRELERLAEFEAKAVFIEADWSDLLDKTKYRSGVSPASVTGSILSWMARYNVAFTPCGNRENACLATTQFLWNAAKSIHLSPVS